MTNTTSPSSFYNQNSTVYTETNPAGPADAPVVDTDTPAPSSFFKETGSPESAAFVTGTQAVAVVAHEWLQGLSGTGVWTQTQPAFSDIAGTIAPSQLPPATSSSLGGVQAVAAVAHEWVSYIDNSGVPHLAQPSASDLSNGVQGTGAVLLASLLAANSGIATLDSGGHLTAAQIPAALVGALQYQGTWNATGAAPSASPATGQFWQVSVAGTTSLSGIAVWNVGDIAIYNGTAWEKIDGITSEVLSVAGRTGAVTLSFTDISGTASAAQLPTPTTGALGGVKAVTNVAHEWVSYIDTTGTPQLSQPAFSDLSGSIAAGQIPSSTLTNAMQANMANGTLKSNISGGSAAPADNSLSSILDSAIGSSVGNLAVRGSGGWTALAPGATSGSVLTSNGTGVAPTYQTSASATVLRSYLAGYTLSNDSTNVNTTLDIAAGMAADSTNAVYITASGTFFKSISSAWASGAGTGASPKGGMGNGLTVAANTWYHVLLANNGGTPDIWFDTSIAGANRPTGITDTKQRYIGSFKTDASSHILGFTQNGDEFIWDTYVADASAVATNSTSANRTMTIPPAINVWWLGTEVAAYSSGGSNVCLYPPDSGSQTANSPTGWIPFSPASTSSTQGGYACIRSNTSGQIGVATGPAGSSYYLVTMGYINRRGRDQ